MISILEILEKFNQLDQNFYGVSIKKFILFLIIILSTIIIRSIFLYIINKKITLLKITKSEEIGMIISAIKDPLGYLILVQGFYIALIYIQLPNKIGPIDINLYTYYILSISFIILYFVFRIIDIISIYIHKKTRESDNTVNEQIAPLIVKILRILVVVIGILSVLSNFGYNITSLVTGLGIGGLAMALAAQTTLSNLFGSITIFSDKPFHVGDRIQIGDVDGTIEEIGLRSTRIRRLDQALAIVPNSMFVNQEIINYSSMKKRKIEFYLGLTYDTSIHKIKDVVTGVQNIIEKNEKFDQSYYIVRLANFGASSLDIYIYCFTLITDYAEFHIVKESLIFDILILLEKLDVEIAFPSNTTYMYNMVNSSKNNLNIDNLNI